MMRIRGTLLFSLAVALAILAACGSPPMVQPTPAPVLRTADEVIDPFISPLPSGAKPPIGAVAPPGRRDVEPAWRFIAPDGRQLKLSQVEAEAVALDYIRKVFGGSDEQNQIDSAAYLYLPSLGRDVLVMTVARNDIGSHNKQIAVDLNSAERVPNEWLQKGNLDNSSFAFVHGKLEERLVAALERAKPDARLRVGVHAFPPNPELVQLELVRLYPELLPTFQRYGNLDRASILDEALGAQVKQMQTRIYAARQAYAREPIVGWLQRDDAMAAESDSTIVWSELTPAQVLRLVREDAVNFITYHGGSDPNVVAPTSTPLPPEWHTVPFTTLEHGIYGLTNGWSPSQPTVWLIRSGDEIGGPAPMSDATLLKLRQVEFEYAINAALLLYRGPQGCGGYDVRITNVAVDDKTLHVFADFYEPAPGEACPAVETAPFHIVTIAQSDLHFPSGLGQIDLIPTTRYGSAWPP